MRWTTPPARWPSRTISSRVARIRTKSGGDSCHKHPSRFCVAHHRPQRLVELMGQGRRQLTETGHTAGVCHLISQLRGFEFSMFAGCDVHGHSHERHRLIVFHEDIHDIPEPHGPAIGDGHPILEIVPPAFSNGRRAQSFDPRTIIRMDMVPPETGHLQPGLDGIPENRFGLLADECRLERSRVGAPEDGAD